MQNSKTEEITSNSKIEKKNRKETVILTLVVLLIAFLGYLIILNIDALYKML